MPRDYGPCSGEMIYYVELGYDGTKLGLWKCWNWIIMLFGFGGRRLIILMLFTHVVINCCLKMFHKLLGLSHMLKIRLSAIDET